MTMGSSSALQLLPIDRNQSTLYIGVLSEWLMFDR